MTPLIAGLHVRDGGRVGGQEQKHLSPLGTKLHFHVNSSRKNYIDHSRKHHNIPQCSLFVTPKFCISIVSSFSWELKWPQEKLKTMLMQNFGVTNKEHYGMLWYFLEWSY